MSIRPAFIQILFKRQREMSRITGVSQGAILKALRRVCESSSITWASIENDYFIRRPYHFMFYEAKRLLSASSIRGELVRRTGRLVFVPTVQGGLVAAVNCDVRWWVQSQPLSFWSSCPWNNQLVFPQHDENSGMSINVVEPGYGLIRK